MAKSKKVVKQKQKQTQIVNINLGTKAKKKVKRKRQPKKEVIKTQNIPAFNPPPIINFPPQYKPYAVFPEGETAKISNLNSAVPVPLKIETEAPLLNAPIPAPNLAQLVAPPPSKEELFAEDDVSVLTEAPEFIDLPEEAKAQVLDLPPAEIASLTERNEPLFDPFKANVPVTSGRSLAESVAEPLSLSGFSYPFSVGETGFAEYVPQSRFLGTLPPIKTAEKSELPFSPLASSGLTVPVKEKAKPYFGEEPPPAVEKKKKQKKVKKPKEEEPTQTLLSVFPITANVEPLGVPIQIGQREEETFKYSPPLGQLEGQYQFLGQPPPPTEKETNPLERRRGGGVLSAAEEAIIGGTPTFIA